MATDISEDALIVAQANAVANGVRDRIKFIQGDLLSPLPEGIHIVAANLPYITDADYAALKAKLV